jgi:hypothetical protein
MQVSFVTSYRASSEAVAVAYLRALLAEHALLTDVSTKLPAQPWSHACYVTVTTAADRADHYFPENDVNVSVNVYGSTTKAWPEAFALADDIKALCYTDKALGTLVPKTGYFPVKLADVTLFTGPTPVRTQDGTLVRVTMSINLVYIHLTEE